MNNLEKLLKIEKIVNQKPLTAPDLLKYLSEHPQHKHIKEKMCKVGMHKHMGDDLVRLEVF